ncbi:unnamed protein product [Rotaria sordida]|uniref:Uncharacterized protein n=1 Tax=Rotaria sordida TaxID=392033 RepID=A0A813US17_9BILA|nr:unnamed protein product [Rotaria sordida]CAF3724048.1 unnamed protein product [Rotaria sordida]
MLIISHVECTTEQQLMRKLLLFYEPSVRPVINAQGIVNISFRMELTQLFELEEKTQVLTTNVRIEQKWKDENLGWNQSEYEGIRGIRLPSHLIWLPDTFIYNAAFDLSSDTPTQGVVNGPYVMVYHTGEVVFPVLMKLRTTCKVNIQYFPFDQQICGLKFASWIYDISSINYVLISNTNNHLQSESIRNGGWAMLDIKEGLVWRTKNNKTYGELVYGVHFRRRPLYYIFNVIIPCAMLSCLTCMSFWLPTSSGEKVTLGLTCFVAFSVFMLMVAEKVPATSDTVPIIEIYLTIVMSLTSISVIMAVIVANLYQQAAMCTSKKHRAPQWLIKFALTKVSSILRMNDKIKNVLDQKKKKISEAFIQCQLKNAFIIIKQRYIDKVEMYANVRITRNSSWDNWGSYGLVFGFFLVIIGMLTQFLEFPRIYNGATNVDLSNNITIDLYNITNYYNHWWPWTYPSNLFGLFTFLTGMIGILAGFRGTYTSIFGFFTMSVVSALFAIYLIVYFTFIISFYRTNGMDKSSNRTTFESVSYGLASTQLTISLINFIISILSAIFAGRAISLCVDKSISEDDIIIPIRPQIPEKSTTFYDLSCEPNSLPLSTNQNELNINYENIIENLLLQQVLLYTNEQLNSSYSTRSHSTITTNNNSLWIEKSEQRKLSKNSHNKHSMITSSKHKNNAKKKPILCLIESDENSSSKLIENIIYYHNQQKDQYKAFDQNLIDLLLKKICERNNISTHTNSTFYFRLQWLAIAHVIDRLFFYIYFTATFISYFITLWLIPFVHPNLTIDIHSL